MTTFNCCFINLNSFENLTLKKFKKMHKKKNILLLLIALLTLPSLYQDLIAHSGNEVDDLLSIIEKQGSLQNGVFNFDPKRWGIVEGKVSDEVALNNKNIINNIIYKVKAMGITTFKIDKMDAYFGVDIDERDPYFGANGTNRFAIFVPSNFNLVMTKNTNLRLQPNGYSRYSLLFGWEVDNVTISGGKLWGDRYTHDYTTIGGTHEWGHLIRFKAVHNGVVDNVEMHEATGDGFEVYGSSDRNADGTLKPNRRESFNITVKNCLINDNRRNNITIADGTNMFFEYNTIISAGSKNDSPSVKSNTTAPGVALMIESREGHHPDGNAIDLWEKVENIHIRNNIFEDNRADLVLLSGEKIYIYENTFKSKRNVSVSAAVNGKVYNNSFESTERLASNSRALLLETRTFANGEDRVKNYEVSNNTFTGYQYAVVAGGQGHTIKDNVVTDCKIGLVLGALKDIEFDNNTISSNIDNSIGYYTFSIETSIKNCVIKNGETNVQGLQLYFSNNNNNDTGAITIDNVDFNGVIALNNVQNTTVKNSTFNNIEIKKCSPTLINNN